MSTYAWIIDKDHLSGPDSDNPEPRYCCEGTSGPRDARGESKDEFRANYQHHHQFRMYDDDRILYVTGTLFWDGDADNPSEEQVYGPLGDYGIGGMGAVEIRYTDRPQWDCG